MEEYVGHVWETPVPMPDHPPLLGHTLDIRDDILQTFTQGWREYGDVVKYLLGPRQVVVVSTPELVQDIFVTRRETFVKHHMYGGKPNGLKIVLGNGLLTNLDNDSWFVQRRMMQPMFHRKYLTSFGAKMVTAGNRLLERWQTIFEPEQVINVSSEMTRVTLDIINQTMFSTDVAYDAEAIGHAVNAAVEFIFRRMVSPITLPLNLPTPSQRRFKKAMQTIDEIIYRIIAERRASADRPGDLLDMLLEAEDIDTGERMNDQQVRDEVATIFGAGHDTTAHTLTWAWYLLAQHPEIQEQLAAELEAVFHGRTPTIADLPALPLTDQIFHEALRLYPAAPILIRVTQHDTLLADFDIPHNIHVMISIYNIHRHPHYWEQPEIFMPQRWATEQVKQRHKHAFMPFGAGQHMCIGNNLALMEGPLLLAMIAQKYRFELAENTAAHPEVAVTLRPRNGMYLRIIPRS